MDKFEPGKSKVIFTDGTKPMENLLVFFGDTDGNVERPILDEFPPEDLVELSVNINAQFDLDKEDDGSWQQPKIRKTAPVLKTRKGMGVSTANKFDGLRNERFKLISEKEKPKPSDIAHRKEVVAKCSKKRDSKSGSEDENSQKRSCNKESPKKPSSDHDVIKETMLKYGSINWAEEAEEEQLSALEQEKADLIFATNLQRTIDEVDGPTMLQEGKLIPVVEEIKKIDVQTIESAGPQQQIADKSEPQIVPSNVWRRNVPVPVYGLTQPTAVEGPDAIKKGMTEAEIMRIQEQANYNALPNTGQKRVCDIVQNWLMNKHVVNSSSAVGALCSINSRADLFRDLKVEDMLNSVMKNLSAVGCRRHNWFTEEDVLISTHHKTYVTVQIEPYQGSVQVSITNYNHTDTTLIPVFYLWNLHWYTTILKNGYSTFGLNPFEFESFINSAERIVAWRRNVHIGLNASLNIALKSLKTHLIETFHNRGQELTVKVKEMLRLFDNRVFTDFSYGMNYLKGIYNTQSGATDIMTQEMVEDLARLDKERMAQITVESPRKSVDVIELDSELEAMEIDSDNADVEAPDITPPKEGDSISKQVGDSIRNGYRPVMGSRLNCREFLKMNNSDFSNLILTCGSTAKKNATGYNIAAWLYYKKIPFIMYVMTQSQPKGGKNQVFDVFHYGLPDKAIMMTSTGLFEVSSFSKSKGHMVSRNLEEKSGQDYLRNKVRTGIEVLPRGSVTFELSPTELDNSNLIKSIKEGDWNTIGMGNVRHDKGSEGIRADDIVFTKTKGAGFQVKFNLRGEMFPDQWYFKQGENTVEFSDAKDMRKFPHEAVSKGMFKIPSDVKMETLGKFLDSTDKMTPDYIIKVSEKRYAIIEIKTTRDNNQVDQKLQEANMIYSSAARKRSSEERDIKIFGLAVSTNSVSTNLPLSEADVMNCIYHYNIALQILDEATAQGFCTLLDDEKADRINLIMIELNNSIFNLEETNEDPTIITEEVKRYFDDYDSKESLEVLKVVLKRVFLRLSTYKSAIEKTEKEVKNMFDESKKELLEGKRREDLKAPVQLPFLYPKKPSDGNIMPPMIYGNTPTEETWSSARNGYFEFEANFEKKEIYTKDMPERVRLNKPSDRAARRKRARISMKMPESVWLALAESGVRAKRYKGRMQIKEKKGKDKLPFDWMTQTADIDQFINNTEFFEASDYENLYVTRASHIVSKACRISGDRKMEELHSDFQDVLNLKGFQGLTVLDEISAECSYSVAQNCKKDEMILKKLKTCNGWILIVPTNSREHIFFSLAIAKSDAEVLGLPFKGVIDSGEHFIFPFVQLDSDRINQYLYLPLRAFGLLVRQNMLFRGDPENLLGSLNNQIKHHFMAELLFYLEDKRQTSSNIQQFRYAYMELICQNDMENPLKIIGKLDKRPKSRLLVWAVVRMINACKIMLENPPVIGNLKSQEVDESEDVCQNLISWVDNSEVKNYEAIIELSYYSNLHNKSRTNETNDNISILKKIVEEELKFVDTRKEYIGKENCRDPGPHEFNKDFVTFCARIARAKMNPKKLSYFNLAKTNIASELCEVTLLDLATTKSSAVNVSNDKMYDPEKLMAEIESEEEKDKDLEDRQKLSRQQKKTKKLRKHIDRQSQKCIISAFDALEKLETNYPFIKLVDIYKEVLSHGGILANIFPKEQIGGAREIFRLEFYSRMLMKFLETTAYAIDKMLPCAMLSKGTSKDQRTYEHYSKLKGKLSRTVTSINSMDCKRWAQNFVMTSFACTFHQLLPKEFKNAFFSVLNQITNKSIEIPDIVCHLFYTHQNIDSMDDNIQILKEEFLGERPPHLLSGKYGKVIKNKTNMMQGQCHVVSDVHHACYLYGMQVLLMRYNRTMNETQKLDIDTLITVKCSSDDSSQLISLTSRKIDLNDDEKNKIVTRAKIYSFCFYEGYPFCCMQGSKEKSTVACFSLVEEFNSKWFFRNTIIAAPIKHIAIAVTTPCTSSFEMRHYEAQNLLMELFESSGSTLLCAYVQIAQAYANYALMGCLTNEDFEFWESQTLRFEHPMFGFFLLQPSRLSGMFSLEFTKYLACKNNIDTLRAESHLYTTNGVEYHSEMGRMYEIRISEGQEEKYKEFLKQMEVDRTKIDEYLGRELWWMTRKPSSAEETRMFLQMKAISPGMPDAMVVKKLHKIFNTSAFIYTEPCMRYKKKGDLEAEKVNFFNACQKIVLDTSISLDLDVEILFENHRIYELIIEASQEDRKLIDCYQLRKRFVNIKIRDPCVEKHLPLKEVLAWRWSAPSGRRRPMGALEDSWEYYLETFPWMGDSMQDCLEHPLCPFENNIALKGFLERHSSDEVRLRSYCCSHMMSDPIKRVISVMNNSPWPGKRYCLLSKYTEKEDRDFRMYDRFIQLCLTIDGPFLDDQKETFCDMILSSCVANDFSTLGNDKMERLRILACIRRLKDPRLGNKISRAYKMRVNKLLRNSRLCTLGKWTVPSELSKGGDDPYVGHGVWSGMVSGRRVKVVTDGSYIQSIILQKTKHNEMGILGEQVKHLMKKLKHVRIPISSKTPCSSGIYYDHSANGMTYFKRDYCVPIEESELPIEELDFSDFEIKYDLDERRIMLLSDREPVLSLKCVHFFASPTYRPPEFLENIKANRSDLKQLWTKWYRGDSLTYDELIGKSLFLKGINDIGTWFGRKLEDELRFVIAPREKSISALSGTVMPENFANEITDFMIENPIDEFDIPDMHIDVEEDIPNLANDAADFDIRNDFMANMTDEMSHIKQVPTYETRKGDFGGHCRMFRTLLDSIRVKKGEEGIRALTSGWKDKDDLEIQRLSQSMGREKLPDIDLPDEMEKNDMVDLFVNTECGHQSAEEENESSCESDDYQSDSD